MISPKASAALAAAHFASHFFLFARKTLVFIIQVETNNWRNITPYELQPYRNELHAARHGKPIEDITSTAMTEEKKYNRAQSCNEAKQQQFCYMFFHRRFI